MFKPHALYMLVTVWISLMIFYELFELIFLAVRKVILEFFKCRKGIMFI